MWTCPKCKREFKKINQMHSCAVFPLENHFNGKNASIKALFDEYVKQIEKNIGPVKIESLPCCIHLVGNSAFGAVWAMKNRIRIDFRLDSKIEDPRIYKEYKMSANRYMYHIDILDKKDIDGQLMTWLKQAYYLK